MGTVTVTFGGKSASLDYTVTTAPQSRGLLFGTSEIAFTALQTLVGSPLHLRRCYDNAMPTTLGASKAKADLDAGRISWISFTSASKANMGAYFASCAADGREVWVTLVHEVNNGPKMSPDAFKALYVDAATARNAAGAANVHLVPILTAEPFRTDAYAQWFGPAWTFDKVGIDPYRFWRPAGSPPDPKTHKPDAAGNLGPSRSMEWLIGNGPSFAASVGKRVVIGETGAHPDPANTEDRPAWLRETVTFLRSISADAWCYFHSHNGESGPWWLDVFHNFANPQDRSKPDPKSVAAFVALLTN